MRIFTRRWERGSGAGVAGLVVGAAALGASDAVAREFAGGAIEVEAAYTADYVFPVAEADGEGRLLDNLDLAATFDMERLAGWANTTVFAYVLHNSGETPNDDLGTLQGVDNIEVERQGLRLYEFWIERQFDFGSIRAGLYDLNSEFYANDSAGLLIAPAFGIGSELAATGPNGPSIFPSTALAVRGEFGLSEHMSLKLAALNAEAGVLGDPGGVDTSFDEGALVIGELSWRGDTHFNVGAWAYTERQDDIRDVDGLGDPVERRAFGGYATIERRFWGEAGGVAATTGFFRIGFSDGDTTDFDGGWQAGILVEHAFAGRPESAWSVGINQAFVSDKYRLNQADDGVVTEDYEGALELTYSDRIGWLTIQPDLQFIRYPGADAAGADAIVGTLRFSVAL